MIQNQTHILTLVKKIMIKILNLKLVILLEYQNAKRFSQQAMFQILVILKTKKLLEHFAKRNYKNQIKKSWKSNKEKTRNGKATIAFLTVGLKKKT